MENSIPSLILSWQIFFPLRPQRLSEPGRPAGRRKEKPPTSGTSSNNLICHLLGDMIPFRSRLSPKPAVARSTRAGCSRCPGWHCPLRSRSSHSRPCCCGGSANVWGFGLYKSETQATFGAYLQLKATALVHDVVELSLEWRQDKDESVLVRVLTNHLSFFKLKSQEYVNIP